MGKEAPAEQGSGVRRPGKEAGRAAVGAAAAQSPLRAEGPAGRRGTAEAPRASGWRDGAGAGPPAEHAGAVCVVHGHTGDIGGPRGVCIAGLGSG